MEALERLQAVHAHLRFLHTHEIATSHGPSNRFLADFLLLLGEAGRSSAEMKRLCEVLVDSVPKMISSSLFDEMEHANASVADSRPMPNSPNIQIAPEDKFKIENVTPPKSNRKGHRRTHNLRSLQLSPGVGEQILTTQEHRSAPCEGGVLNCMVSFKSMERARSTLEDFCRSYFMFHNMDVQNPAHVFRHLPLLVFVESYIYQLDEQNEDQLCLAALSEGSNDKPEISSEFTNGFGRDPFAGLRAVLQEHDLLTKRIEDELMDGLQYWRLEHILCTALSTKEEVKVDDILQALRLKSFDYRVLNLLMYGLRNEPVNEAHFEFLSISELLVEIADDLFDYEEDVGKNSFNVLRMFLYTFGPSEAPTMLADFIAKSEDKYQVLLEELEPNIRAQYKKRCEEAVKEGGSKSMYVQGSLTIPGLICEEDAFRKHRLYEQLRREVEED